MSRPRVYVGPYIKCLVDRIVPNKEIWTCSSDICDLVQKRKELSKDHKFCSQCGSPAAMVTVQDSERDAISTWTINEETNERLSEYNGENAKKGIHLYVPNQDWPRPFIVDGDDDSIGEVMVVEPDIIKTEKAWLTKEFAAEMKIVKKHYGAAKVQVLWGILAEYR